MEVGDTVTVRTTGGSVWGGDGKLIEEAAIGTETRGENDLLGEVTGIDATSDRIFIADRVFVTVRVYDMAGNHVMNIGRHGGGPGEFYSVEGLVVDPLREELVVREFVGTLHRLTLSGTYVERMRPRVVGAVSGGPDPYLRVTREGVTMIRHMYFRPNPGGSPPGRVREGLFRMDSTGALKDTLDVPTDHEGPYVLRTEAGREGSFRPLPVPFGPQETWGVTRDGAFIWGNTSEYRFEIRYPNGRRTVIERDTDPVPVKAEERRAAERRVFGIMRSFQPGWVWNGPEIPETKPFYTAVIPDRSGRLWVLREGEGRRVEGWQEPSDWQGWEQYPAWVSEHWFEVFEEDSGRYLGRVEVPKGFVRWPEPFIEGDRFICLTEDDMGRQIVRRYRLILPGG